MFLKQLFAPRFRGSARCPPLNFQLGQTAGPGQPPIHGIQYWLFLRYHHQRGWGLPAPDPPAVQALDRTWSFLLLVISAADRWTRHREWRPASHPPQPRGLNKCISLWMPSSNVFQSPCACPLHLICMCPIIMERVSGEPPQEVLLLCLEPNI